MADFLFLVNILTSFDILTRVTIFAALSYLIYMNLPGLLISLLAPPIQTLAKPTPSYISLASCLHKSTAMLLANFKALDQCVFHSDQANANNLPLPICLVELAQRFVSWLLTNDCPAKYYPMVMAVSTGHKMALGLLSSAAGAKPSRCMTQRRFCLCSSWVVLQLYSQ